MKLLRYTGASLVAAFGLFLFVAYFSAVETRFQCSGELSYDSNPQKATLYIKLNEYRWWVGLWTDSVGSITLEVQNKPLVDSFVRMEKIGDQLLIYDYEKRPQGYFSTLSKTLAVTTSRWSFDGICNYVEK